MPPRDRTKIPSQANGAISEDGFFVGTNTKAWSPENDALGIEQNSRARGPMPGVPAMEAPAPFKQPETLPATQRAQQAAQQRYQGIQQSQQVQQGQQQPPMGMPGGGSSNPMTPPTGFQKYSQQGQQQPPMGMPGGSSNPMTPPGGFQQVGGTNFQGQNNGYNKDVYSKSYEELERARQAVSVDKRFSPEQRQQAFERLASRADELDQGFAQGREIMGVPTGYDSPPPEEFSNVQDTGLETMNDGRIRNPETGDVMRSIKSPNGQLIPVTSNQDEIDSLPEGTRYVDGGTGKVAIAGASSSGGKPSSSGSRGSSAAQPGSPMTSEDAFAAYEKWNKGVEPGTTREERSVIDAAIGSVEDPEQQSQLRQMLASDPQSVLDTLTQNGTDLTDQLEDARANAFARDQKSRTTQRDRVSKAMGIEAPQEEPKKPIDSKKYFTEVGTRGTMQVRRRGSNIAIPTVMGEDGQPRPAPQQMRQLADLEVDTEFANVISQDNGKETRILPFNKQMVNLGNFALTDQQRSVFAKETGKIEARSPEAWDSFEGLIQQFQSSGEVWDPKNPTSGQKQVQEIVSNFYRELGPEGKAMMTMYVAHGLGYKVDQNRAFTSTGWGKDESKSRGMTTSEKNLPTNFLGNDFAQKIYKVGFDGTEDSLGSYFDDSRGQPKKSASYNQDLGDMAKNMFKIATEQGARKMSDNERKDFGSRDLAIFRMIDSVSKNKDFGKSAKGKIIVDDLTKMAKQMMGNYEKKEEKAYTPPPERTPKPSASPSEAAPKKEEKSWSQQLADKIIGGQRPNAPRKDTGGFGSGPQSIGPARGSETPDFTPMPEKEEDSWAKQLANKIIGDQRPNAPRKKSEGFGSGAQSIGPTKGSETPDFTPMEDKKSWSQQLADKIIGDQRPNAPRKDSGGFGSGAQSVGPTKGSETPDFTPMEDKKPWSRQLADKIIGDQRPNAPRRPKDTKGMGGSAQSVGPGKESKTPDVASKTEETGKSWAKQLADKIIGDQRPNAPRKKSEGMGSGAQSVGPTKGSETPGFKPMPDASERLKQNAEKKRLDEEYRAKREASRPPVQFAREVPKKVEEDLKKARKKKFVGPVEEKGKK